MKRLLIALLLAPAAAAQEKAAEEAKPAAAQEQPPAEAAQETAAPPSPVAESPVHVTLEAGYRGIRGVGGDFNTYRSLVNLGEGPQMGILEISANNPSRRIFDRLTLRGNNWGDPYNTAHFDIERRGAYRLTVDYRSIFYFNFLPSFANPFASDGVLVNQRSMDLRRRGTEVVLELFPQRRIVPYLQYSRDAGSGTGITPFVSNANEYPVATILRDSTDRYAGGVRFEMRKWNLTLEQGGTVFKDDQQAFSADRNLGNRATTLQGRQLFLSELAQAYGVRGDGIYSKGLLTAAPAGWVHLYGQLFYTQPSTTVQYQDSGRGLFFLGGSRFFNGQESLLSSLAKQPHITGHFAAEIFTPWRLRLVESLSTDRLHDASSALLAERILTAGSADEARSLFTTDRLAVNYHRQQADAFFDALRQVTLRAGHRYTWGDASLRAPVLNPAGRQAGEMRQQVVHYAATARGRWNTLVHAERESSFDERSYFRTSLHNYQRVRLRARARPLPSLEIGAALALLDNENPSSGIGYDYRDVGGTATVHWTPAGGKHGSLLAEYTRARLRSDLSYLEPQSLTPVASRYLENAHQATAVGTWNLPQLGGRAAVLTAGGSLFHSRGTRPARYYQPVARVQAPVAAQCAVFVEWRWYGYAQPLYLYEGFRSHQVLGGLRISR
jgi:hypothetical protein